MHKAPIQEHDDSTLDLVYDEAKDQLSAQRDYTRALDNKAELILGSSTLIITIVAGLRAIRATPSVGGTSPPSAGGPTLAAALSVGMFALAGAFYVAAMILAFRAYMVRTWHEQVGPDRLRDKYLCLDPSEAKRRLLENMGLAFEKNRETISRHKVPSLKRAFVCQMLENLALFAALILSGL